LGEKAFLIDTTKCIACGNCTAACIEWNNIPPSRTISKTGFEYSFKSKLSSFRWIDIIFTRSENEEKSEWSAFPTMCLHCRDANCIKVCPEDAISSFKGWVVIDQHKCIGCGNCEEVCPYKAVFIHRDKSSGSIKVNHAFKCQGCIENYSSKPVCAANCPTSALVYDYRIKLIKAAKKRLTEIKTNNPKANIYGIKEFSGLNVLYILKNKPVNFGFPEKLKKAELTKYLNLKNVYSFIPKGFLGKSLKKIAFEKLNKFIS